MANVPITSLPEATAPSANDYLILQGASTQRIKWSALLDKLYPVGCIYQSASATSPASFLGGTWERIKDKFILAAGDTYAAGSTGGEAEHTLTIPEMPNHTHRLWVEGKTLEAEGRTLVTSISANQKTVDISQNLWMDSRGESKSHNNMPPYLAAYVWRRIA